MCQPIPSGPSHAVQYHCVPLRTINYHYVSSGILVQHPGSSCTIMCHCVPSRTIIETIASIRLFLKIITSWKSLEERRYWKVSRFSVSLWNSRMVLWWIFHGIVCLCCWNGLLLVLLYIIVSNSYKKLSACEIIF